MAITKKKFEKAIKNTGGVISTIARNLDVTRKAVYDYVEKRPKAKELLEEEKEKPFDKAENVIMKKLEENDLKAAEIYLLRHKKGRERGWGERQEIQHSTDKGTITDWVQALKEAKNNNEQ